MSVLTNIKAMSNSMLNRPLQGALSRVASQNMGFYAAQPQLAQMAQEERLRQEQDGLVNSMPNRKQKLKAKALSSPLSDMSNVALSGSMTQTKTTPLGGTIYG